MNKMIPVSLLALGLSSAPAFASKARLLALGETEESSYYIRDFRNIFINAGVIANYNDMIIGELGGAGNALNKKDAPISRRAEGGMLKTIGDYTMGLFLGYNSRNIHEARTYVHFHDPRFYEDNKFHLLFGGGSDMKWGVRVGYTRTKDEQTQDQEVKQHSLTWGFGLDTEKWSWGFNSSLSSEAERNLSATTKNVYDPTFGMKTNGNYRWDGFTAFGDLTLSFFDLKNDGALFDGTSIANGSVYAGDAEASVIKINTGLGHEMKTSSNGTVFAKVAIDYKNYKLDLDQGNGEIKLTSMALPVTFAYEHQANEWLALRGSVTQNIYSSAENKGLNNNTANLSQIIVSQLPGGSTDGKKTLLNSTNVNLGATLTFGNLTIDGMLGTGSTGNVDNETGILSLDNLMTSTSVTYMF